MNNVASPDDLAGFKPSRLAEGYRYDHEAADLAVEWIQSECVHVEGMKARDPFMLEEWQADIVRTVFGWKRPNGKRRFRIAYLEVPRKNGKSTLLAAMVLLVKFCPAFREPGAQMFSAAGDREQASLVYRIAAAMVRRNPRMSSRCKVRDSVRRIITPDGFYRAVAAGEGKQHGTNPSLAVCDEVHVWRGDAGRALWDELISGMGSREEPIMLAATTAGYDKSSVCWEQHEYARKVRDGLIADATYLPILYGADSEDDWTSLETWKEANPNLGASVRLEFLQQECEKAKASPLYENTFRRLYLNQWTEQAVRWMPMEEWKACNESIDEEGLIGKQCYVGIDMASERDLASMAAVWPLDDGVYAAKVFYFCPQEAISVRARQDRQGYSGWVGTAIEATPGKSIDQSIIRARLWELAEKHNIADLAFDGWNMTEFWQTLVREGWRDECGSKYPQNTSNYNEPMKKMLDLVRERKLIHGNNPVLEWNASNIVAFEDTNGNYKPDKGKSQDKIDGMCALLMALGRALTSEGVVDNRFYEDHDIEMG